MGFRDSKCDSIGESEKEGGGGREVEIGIQKVEMRLFTQYQEEKRDEKGTFVDLRACAGRPYGLRQALEDRVFRI
jgi:hypothetical protein